MHDLSDTRVGLVWDSTLRYPGANTPPDAVDVAFRRLLVASGLDGEGTGDDWNPFGAFVSPGQMVVISPNAVYHSNFNPTGTVWSVITHGSVLRSVVACAARALNGSGRIVVADASLAHCDFAAWRQLVDVEGIIESCRRQYGLAVEVLDLRNLYVPWNAEAQYAPPRLRQEAVRDPRGYIDVDLGAESLFSGLDERLLHQLYGSDADRSVTVEHHTGGRHVYRVSRTVLDADVFIAVPKLKTHMKVGVTANLKGMVGTQCDKSFIPHFRLGPPRKGGDEHPDCGRMQEWLSVLRHRAEQRYLVAERTRNERTFRRISCALANAEEWLRRSLAFKYGDASWPQVHGGAWHGNDTAWRMALDLSRIVLYATPDGTLSSRPQRRFFSVVDGIVGGDANGPLSPRDRPCGLLLAGSNPWAVDSLATRVMGFNPQRVRLLSEGQGQVWLNPSGVAWEDIPAAVSGKHPCPSRDLVTGRSLCFEAPDGWHGHMEWQGVGQ